ncbi:hypothetical protein dqs_1797 [Azoarcus olearius]|uniref:AAA family ATPase n=1 Tax=Azoarcus sp. (strain BH72) TaxID=418699 RepID=UPI000806419A|nr:AAA family ATPase [Azoarcus olearius]ANQ84835.1 hypothetical protein dqs_1797 [Azoarcus olearius]
MNRDMSFIALMHSGAAQKEMPPGGGIQDQQHGVTSAGTYGINDEMKDTDLADAHGHDGESLDDYLCEPARPEEFESLVAQVQRQVAQVICDAQNPLVTITRFANKKETAGKRHDVTWEKLCDVLANPREYPSKVCMPLVKLSKLPNNSRVMGTVPENMTAVVGDYDGGLVTVDEAVARLASAGISAAVYTTASHRHDEPRWRVVAQLGSPVTPDEYVEYLDLVNGALGGILASESWETTRSYFYGKVKGVEYRFESVPGVPIDIQAACGVDWEPIGKPGETVKTATTERAAQAQDDDRDFERTITISKANDRTLHDLEYALEAIKDRAVARGPWNETFLAMVCFKGTEYEDRARALIEGWSQTHGVNWCVKEPDDTKWDRESARDITYTSIFKWADEQDELQGVLRTDESWRAKAKAAWREMDAAGLGGNVVPYTEFTRAMEPPSYVWHRVLQKGCLYALTAKWGHGKTALMITVAMHVATGRELGGHQVERQRVLYLCGENPADVQLRITAAALKFGMPPSELSGQIFFTRRPFALDNDVELKRFVKEASAFGPFGMAVIDTGPAHSSAEEENDNREMHKLAMAMRDLMEPLGNPATVALMHPTKEATRDNLQPRGGGAFSGSIDGELCAWQERGQVEFFHRTKFRGPGFKPIRFELERFELPGMEDNFGEPVVTVLAVQSDSTDPSPIGRKPLTGAVSVAYRALDAALADMKTSRMLDAAFAGEASNALNCPAPEAAVHLDDWRGMAYDMGISDGDGEAKKKAFKRGRERLVADGIVKVWKDMCWLRGGA